ncbi:hypothetical protein K432DRAFT_378487 [Lepidopterella palustris CBS 459.81]|uniref:Ankyrin n=1 Tax=Lepidopterella palustris CBS 459.81 TaxID=1314670 RepID=A0A8E2EID7_9PEZI|nr:hypothetical protein K432DRAFT_378487 [Lepidopterella palustris CBS 459.81]
MGNPDQKSDYGTSGKTTAQGKMQEEECTVAIASSSATDQKSTIMKPDPDENTNLIASTSNEGYGTADRAADQKTTHKCTNVDSNPTASPSNTPYVPRRTYPDGLPTYTATEPADSGLQSILNRLYDEAASSASPEDAEEHGIPALPSDLPILADPSPDVLTYRNYMLDPRTRLRRDIVDSFFASITSKKDEAVAMLIDQGLVTPNTTDSSGRTPLLAAVQAGNVRMVQELLDFGADINGYGSVLQSSHSWVKVRRTPLQLAAALGNYHMVKLFMEVYHADDALVAPDGELALRLAADNGHRDIVDYLPPRRGGGWRRWKTRHATAMERAARAARKIYFFGKCLVWYVPKFIVWDIPKYCIVIPIRDGLAWAWKHRRGFATWCKRQVVEMPKRLGRAAKSVWKGIKAVPKTIWNILKFFFRAIIKIPNAIKLLALWLWAGLKSIGAGLAAIGGRILSFLHTIFSALIDFFRTITLADVWNGFCVILHAIFVDLPVKLGHWVWNFGEMSYKVMETLFGCAGQVLWWIATGLLWLVVYVPRKIWVVLTSFGQSIGNAWVELLVWINPKR